jgi:anti-sigma regulatory factor (Ser/Thr protein kinase)
MATIASTLPLTARPTEILLSLSPVPDAVRVARHALQERGVSAELDHTVSLLASELVGNAVRHADQDPGQKIVFFARVRDDHVHVEVADHGSGFDPDVRHTTSGFGLRLVDKLATRWGVEHSGKGCRVWFEVDRRRRRFARDDPPSQG